MAGEGDFFTSRRTFPPALMVSAMRTAVAAFSATTSLLAAQEGSAGAARASASEPLPARPVGRGPGSRPGPPPAATGDDCVASAWPRLHAALPAAPVAGGAFSCAGATRQTQGAQKAASSSRGGGGTPPAARMRDARTAEETASLIEITDAQRLRPTRPPARPTSPPAPPDPAQGGLRPRTASANRQICSG